jgi:hypothetical protein
VQAACDGPSAEGEPKDAYSRLVPESFKDLSYYERLGFGGFSVFIHIAKRVWFAFARPREHH